MPSMGSAAGQVVDRTVDDTSTGRHGDRKTADRVGHLFWWSCAAAVMLIVGIRSRRCCNCYYSDRLRDGFHAAWNGFCLDSALKPAGLFGCGWPRRTRKLLAGRWVLNRQDLMTVDGRLGHKTLDDA
ncbi:hypothetical protein ACLOJK_006946 [Asimina triloba]